ncbi:hypothetical protein L228DRAFT_279684 [Xylona heveae TC161]|uniref:ADP-ribosylation factor n=1 Tax=Xylona heveae (strain CBS 132557 / TC161) TaxID=1328760 RepID=A0A165JPU9_XYLHT|nr:hypothetical protein L228DRAFT_279684 [Xylona heveae TC161]KZF26495.1 hypothetical protein L228DRAFT_279684 [Xylona heveae TC161]
MVKDYTSPQETRHPYYKQTGVPNLFRQFHNFDDKTVFGKYEELVNDADSRNFVIDFSTEEAWAAFNLQSHDFIGLLKTKRPPSLGTRWINIWAPNLQKDVVQAIALYYGFSPRLLGLMCSDPLKPMPMVIAERKRRFYHRTSKDDTVRKTASSYVTDAEVGIQMTERKSAETSALRLDLNHYHLVDEVWHYSSVDWGRSYMCLGFNSLYNVHIDLSNTDDKERSRLDVPDGKRVWSWLIICDDGTVISVHEDPFPGNHCQSKARKSAIRAIRRNLLIVFGQLSRATDESDMPNPITLLPIRKGPHTPQNYPEGVSAATNNTDAPSLLLYYLFDDWYTSYSLVVRTGHQYAAELDKLREQMLDKPELRQIDRLHHIGRQLGVLKRIYRSYELIIDRVLEKQRPATFNQMDYTEPQSTHGLKPKIEAITRRHMHRIFSDVEAPETDGFLGAPLSQAAIVRFERLKDRIGLYALSEIQECLEEKESLVLMNFNLIAIKESFSVERLTRITILLSKVAMLFMPVSLMTAYFSVQIPDLQSEYTATTYWASFSVIMALSVLSLVVFGMLSGTVEGKTIYKPFSQSIAEVYRRTFRPKKKIHG